MASKAAAEADAAAGNVFRPDPSLDLRISLLPLHFTKTIHLIRHGQGYHNVAGLADPAEWKSFEWEDAHLTPRGWRQARALGAHVRALGPRFRPELVVVSPLIRTLETAVGVFGTRQWREEGTEAGEAEAGDATGVTVADLDSDLGPLLPPETSGVPHPPLMLPQPGDPDGSATGRRRPSAAGVSSEGVPRMLAWEGCREHLGVHPCDRRRPTSEASPAFPGIDFSLIERDEDELWLPDVRESREDLRERGRVLVEWLLRRPEREIVVVSHGGILHHALENFGHSHSAHVRGRLHRWFENCEMRSVALAVPQASAEEEASWGDDPFHFKGALAVE